MGAAKVSQDFVKCKHGDAERKRAYGIGQAVYSARGLTASKLAYMTSKRRQKSVFAVDRGKKIRELREGRTWSQEQLRERIGLDSREAVSQYETGSIKVISLPVVRKLMTVLGMRAEELLEDPSILTDEPQGLHKISAEARRIAYVWDELPPMLQAYLDEHITTWSRLKRNSPVLASMLSTKTDNKSRAQHERDMEEFTKEFVAKHTRKEGQK